MILKVLGSESAGNCYILQTDDEILVIEAGLRIQALKQALDHDLSRVVGCLVSHIHGDHFKYSRDFAKYGIDIYTGIETIEAAGTLGHRFHPVKSTFILGKFTVIPFPVPHGVPCLGFLINHPDSGKILFVTDAAYIPHKFIGLSQIMIEANYEDAILTSDRAIGRHMSIDTCLGFLRANDMSTVRNIVLLHLSAANSDALAFAKAVYPISPNAAINVADKGLQLEFNKYPF